MKEGSQQIGEDSEPSVTGRGEGVLQGTVLQSQIEDEIRNEKLGFLGASRAVLHLRNLEMVSAS